MLALALLFVPIIAGGIAGVLLRLPRRGRFVSAWSAIALPIIPPLAALGLWVRFQIVGVYDAALEGSLLGAALLITSHQLFAAPRTILLSLGSLIAGLGALEIGCRILLPIPPSFPPATPRLLLSADDWKDLQGDAGGNIDTSDEACAIVYGSAYASTLASPKETMPRRFTIDAKAKRHILNIGDSMVYGDGVPNEATFESQLDKLEPGVQHLNAGVPGAAPDEYFAVMNHLLKDQRFDAIVMYIFEGNDLELDLRHPCAGMEPLLTYDGNVARMRYPDGPHVLTGGRRRRSDRGINSPPPYLLRLLANRSVVAAYASAALVELRTAKYAVDESEDVRVQHLGLALKASRDEARAKGIPFAVVFLAQTGRDPATRTTAPKMLAASRDLGIPTLDSSPMIAAALARGEKLLLPDRVHFNERGQVLLAQWLHEQLPAALGLPPIASAP